MALPYMWESTFDLGTNAEWASETDTGNLLDFPHYTQLSQQPGSSMAPFKGAYCMRIQMGDANPHIVSRVDASMAFATTNWFRFMFMVGSGWVTAGTTNTFHIARLTGVATTSGIASIGLRAGRLSATQVEMGVGSSVATVFNTSPLDLDRWYSVELQVVSNADATTGAAGSETLYVDGVQWATAAMTTNLVAPTTFELGVRGNVAANVGTLLYDLAAQDEGRIGPLNFRSGESKVITKDQHIFVGKGFLDDVTLVASTTVATGAVFLYDTDSGGVLDQSKLKLVLRNTTSGGVDNLAGMPVQFDRGCYAVLTPTAVASTPMLQVTFRATAETSFANKRLFGQRVKRFAADSL